MKRIILICSLMSALLLSGCFGSEEDLLDAPESVKVKLGSDVNFLSYVTLDDDLKLDDVEVYKGNFNADQEGRYTITFSVTDADGEPQVDKMVAIVRDEVSITEYGAATRYDALLHNSLNPDNPYDFFYIELREDSGNYVNLTVATEHYFSEEELDLKTRLFVKNSEGFIEELHESESTYNRGFIYRSDENFKPEDTYFYVGGAEKVYVLVEEPDYSAFIHDPRLQELFRERGSSYQVQLTIKSFDQHSKSVQFKDSNINDWFYDNVNFDDRALINEDFASKVEALDFSDKGLTNIAGLEYFINLSDLNFKANKLTTISKLEKLYENREVDTSLTVDLRDNPLVKDEYSIIRSLRNDEVRVLYHADPDYGDEYELPVTNVDKRAIKRYGEQHTYKVTDAKNKLFSIRVVPGLYEFNKELSFTIHYYDDSGQYRVMDSQIEGEILEYKQISLILSLRDTFYISITGEPTDYHIIVDEEKVDYHSPFVTSDYGISGRDMSYLGIRLNGMVTEQMTRFVDELYVNKYNDLSRLEMYNEVKYLTIEREALSSNDLDYLDYMNEVEYIHIKNISNVNAQILEQFLLSNQLTSLKVVELKGNTYDSETNALDVIKKLNLKGIDVRHDLEN